MAAEDVLKKSTSKLLIVYLKVLPSILAIVYIANIILSYFNIEIEAAAYIIWLLMWIFIYLSAIVFRFCFYHKMFLWYILASTTLSTIDFYIGIPVSNTRYLMLHIVLLGIFLFAILHKHMKNNNIRLVTLH